MTLGTWRSAKRALFGLFTSILFTAASSLFGTTGAFAQLNYPLTTELVGNFVASFDEVLSKTDDLSAQYGVPEGDVSNPMEAFGAYMAHQGAMAELNGIVTSHGFSGFPEWIQVASSVAVAYAFVREGGAPDTQMSEAAEQIRNNPNFTDAQKEALLAQVQAGAASLGALRPSQENLDAVAPYSDEIAELFDD
jgi:hypothetical protein